MEIASNEESSSLNLELTLQSAQSDLFYNSTFSLGIFKLSFGISNYIMEQQWDTMLKELHFIF